MLKLLNLNSLAHASAWLAEQTGDDGFSPEYLIELGNSGSLRIFASIPANTLILPKGVGGDSGFGLRLELVDGVVEFSRFDCHLMQAKGHTSVAITQASNWRFTYQLKSSVDVTMAMLRIKRSELIAFAAKQRNQTVATDLLPKVHAPESAHTDTLKSCGSQTSRGLTASPDQLALLFDPVKVPQLEAMFPDSNWAKHVERASRNGLKDAAKVGRGLFNPYKAAIWWLETGPAGWDWAKCQRKLASNLPNRSLDQKHLLTGVLE